MVETHVVEDRDVWNAFITAFPTADLRQSYEWGEIRRHQAWTPLRLAAVKGGKGIAALSVATRRLPGLGVVAYAPRGPALDPDDNCGWEALPALAAAVRDATGAVFLRTSPGLPGDRSDVQRRLARAGFLELPDFWPRWAWCSVACTVRSFPPCSACASATSRTRFIRPAPGCLTGFPSATPCTGRGFSGRAPSAARKSTSAVAELTCRPGRPIRISGSIASRKSWALVSRSTWAITIACSSRHGTAWPACSSSGCCPGRGAASAGYRAASAVRSPGAPPEGRNFPSGVQPTTR